MKQKRLIWMTAIWLIALVSASGCEKKESAGEYVGRMISSAKENTEDFAGVLDDGIAEVKEKQGFVIDFPEELKEPYEEFLRSVLSQIQFNVNKAEKDSENTYTVKVTYAPVDIGAATEAANMEFVKQISSADFCSETKKLLKKDKELLQASGSQQKKSMTIKVDKSGGGFVARREDMKALLKDALQGYMAPYSAVAQVFNMRDFIQSYLDASMKNETEEYQKHVGFSSEEAARWYEDSFAGFQIGDLSEEQNGRYISAVKTIYHNCQYSVGTVKQNSMTEYMVDITTTPNNSFLDAMNEFNAGTYYSQAEVSESFVKCCEAHAAAPSYGEETTVTITWNSLDMISSQRDNPEYNRMIETIIPTE